MKLFFAKLGIAALTIAGPAVLISSAQTAKDDMKQAGHDTKEAAKNTGRAAKKTGHKVKKGTKHAVNKAAGKTKAGADKVQEKTQP
ncbi:MAG: hypothetical protein U0Q18_26670 [Bryobacteraceae bacterium]